MNEREIEALRNEIALLRDYVNGLLGLVQLISSRTDLPSGVAQSIRTNHRYMDALAHMMGKP